MRQYKSGAEAQKRMRHIKTPTTRLTVRHIHNAILFILIPSINSLIEFLRTISYLQKCHT